MEGIRTTETGREKYKDTEREREVIFSLLKIYPAIGTGASPHPPICRSSHHAHTSSVSGKGARGVYNFTN